MTIEVKKSIELISEEWSTYTQSFNQVFNKSNSTEYFKHKYINSIDGFSYHALLKDEEFVVGGCTIIPYEYYFKNEINKVGLTVDVFISKNYRKDPYYLYDMYEKLKKELILNGISLVIAVPNDTAYSYWKNIVKWKDIGFLKYYAIAIRLGNTIGKIRKILNVFSLLTSNIFIAISFFVRSTEKLYLIRINRVSNIIEKQRYTHEHNLVNQQNIFYSYHIVNEAGIETCYLIDFYCKKTKIKDSFTLYKAIRYICRKERVDLILYVGQLSFFQMLLFKVPFRSEPKHLYFMADVINFSNIRNIELIYNIKNWDFGLLNYDVR